MSNKSPHEKFAPNWEILEAESESILRRPKYNNFKIIMFSLYTLVGLAITAWGGRILSTVDHNSPEVSVGYATLSFGLAIVGFGFTFFGFKRDRETENVTAGIYLLLKNTVRGQDAVMPSKNSADDLPEHGPWCACYCKVASLKAKSE